MKRRTLWILGVVLVCVLAGIGTCGLYIYRSWPISVKKGERIICSDPKHQGNRILENNIETIEVPRSKAGKYRIVEKKVVCTDCKPVKVQCGEKVVCPDCGEVLQDATEFVSVPKREASQYKLIVKQKICRDCNEQRQTFGGSPKEIVIKFINSVKQGRLSRAQEYVKETVMLYGDLGLTRFGKDEFAQVCVSEFANTKIEIKKEKIIGSTAEVLIRNFTVNDWNFLLLKEYGYWRISGVRLE